MRPLAFSDNQMNQLRQSAAALPVQLRENLLKLLVAHMELEGESTDGAFQRALAFALDTLPAGDGTGTTTCSR
jgi:hypothetical protein